MSSLSILTLLLKLAAYFARRAERSDIEKAVLNEIENIHSKRVDRAVAARDDVLAGRVHPELDDEFRRD
ncbi:hypothetical protein ABE527_02220 [Brucella sp. TWI432]